MLFQQSFGHRNKPEQLANQISTSFSVASVTKLFTGLAVCKLIEQGALKLDDTLSVILSSYELGSINPTISVKQLLTHTSGMGDYIDEDNEDIEALLQHLYDTYPPHLWTSMDYYLQMSKTLPAKFIPGERYAYSNSGYVMLGLVIEAVSGQSYQDYVRTQIIEKLDLTGTGFYRADHLPADTAVGYEQDEDTEQWRSNVFGLPVVGGSDGGIYTCADDLNRLWRGIVGHRLFGETMTAQFLANQVIIEEDGSQAYGLGVYHWHIEGKTVHYAVGGDTGTGAFTAYYPATGLVVSGLSNTGWINGTYDLIKKFSV